MKMEKNYSSLIRKKTAFYIPALTILICLSTKVSAIDITIPDTMGFSTGQMVNIPIYTGSITGQQVYSYYTKVVFDPAILTCTGVLKTGTISSPWSNPTINTSVPGEVSIAAYSTTTLSGSGVLLFLKFTVIGTTGTATALNFSYFLYNEGTPSVSLNSGSLFVGTPTPISLSYTKTDVSCFGLNDGAINLTATGGLSPKQYLWSNGATTEDLNNLIAGSYSVTVTDGFSQPATTSVTITQPGSFSINLGNDTNFCQGNSLLLDAGSGYIQYEWSDGSAQQTLLVNNSGTYWARAKNGSGCWSLKDSIVVNVKQLPNTADSISGDANVCAGQSTVQYTTPIIPNADSYVWQLPTGAFGTSNTNTINVTFSASAISGNISVSGLNDCGAGSHSIKAITVSPLIQVNAGSDDTICQGDSLLVTATAGNGSAPYTFSWSSGMSGSAINVAPSITTSYILTVTDANGCTGTDQVSVFVYSNPSVSIQGDGDLCAGESTSFLAAPSPSGNYSYFWWPGGANTASVTFNNPAVGNQLYSVTVTDVNGCIASNNKTLTVMANPTLYITGDSSICSGDSTTLTANPLPVGAYSFYWLPGGNESAAISLNNLTTGTYSYTVNITDNFGCTASASQIVNVFNKPSVNISGVNNLCYGESTVLTANSLPSGNFEYLWTPGGNTTQIITKNNLQVGSHVFQVIITDQNGCEDSDQEIVTVHPNPTVMITGVSNIFIGDSTILAAIPSPPGSYAFYWSPGGFTSQSIAVGPTDDTLYIVTVTNTTTNCSASDSVLVTVSNAFTVNAKVILQAATLSSGMMTTTLNSGGYIPQSQPYDTTPWNYQGNEQLTNIPPTMTDWVLVELRSAVDTIIARSAGLLLSNGTLADTSGLPGIHFLVPPGTYYLAIHHRNHLSVMSRNKIEYPDTTTYDFSDTLHFPVYGNCVINFSSGISAMISGDVNHDGKIKYSGLSNDRSPILQRILLNTGGTSINGTTQGYYSEDLNMNAQVKYSGAGNDPSLIIQNIVYLTGLNSITGVFTGCVPPGHVVEPAPEWVCGDTLTDTRDGQQYPTVQIGTHCWMAKNLNIGTMVSGSSNQTNNSTIEKYCYNNDANNCAIYGGLYQWNEMMGYTTTPGTQGICPTGWHIPTDAEWCTLTTYLDATVNCNVWDWSGTNAGGKMKETGFDHWSSPNTGATNSSGFTALGAGYRSYGGPFGNLRDYAAFWSSSESSSTTGVGRYLGCDYADVYRGTSGKADGFSMRCLRDSIPPCTPQPDQANAGPDSFNIRGTSITMLANQPVNGSGIWTILSGTGGSFSDSSFHNTLFTGQVGNAYSLIWTISNPCGSTRDTVNISFADTSAFTCGATLTDTRDGQQYPTVQIGTQCWMAKNLNIGTMVSGSSNQTNNSTIEKYCYNNDANNCAIYGGLYQWNETMGYTTTPGTQGICPTGWHIPTDAEWCTLTTYLDATVNCNTWGWSGTNAGGKMKATGFDHWYSPNTGATNSSGFTALGAGDRYFDGNFGYLRDSAHFWSSSEYSSTDGVYWTLAYAYAPVDRSYYNKPIGFSVRCLRN